MSTADPVDTDLHRLSPEFQLLAAVHHRQARALDFLRDGAAIEEVGNRGVSRVLLVGKRRRRIPPVSSADRSDDPSVEKAWLAHVWWCVTTLHVALQNGSDLHVNERQKIRDYRGRSIGEKEEEEEDEMAIVYFARRVPKLRYYGDVIHSFYWKSVVEHNGSI